MRPRWACRPRTIRQNKKNTRIRANNWRHAHPQLTTYTDTDATLRFEAHNPAAYVRDEASAASQTQLRVHSIHLHKIYQKTNSTSLCTCYDTPLQTGRDCIRR